VSALASCFLFEKAGKMQDIVHLLKYRGMMSIGVELGRMLGQKILDEGRFDPSSVLAPVPLHRLKRRERGFNQSELICRGVSAITGMPLRNDLLIRRSNTRSQTKLTLEERKENVKNAFEVNEKKRKAVRDADIILVDDVITTGSTIEAGAKTLLTAGAARVFAASIALAEQKNSSKTGGLFFTPVLGTF
jgi:ComF family protein